MNTKVYRYKFSQEFTNAMQKFIDIHRFDEIKVFKEAWNKWYCKNMILINNEQRHLEGMGYNGDVKLKMYKSARYYYKNKSLEKTVPKKRKVYIHLNKSLLVLMDDYIKQNKEKPSIAYENFAKLYLKEIKETQTKLLKQSLCNKVISAKIKKTFKNRCFRMKIK